MRWAVSGLLLGALLLGAVRSGRGRESGTQSPEPLKAITLTNDRPAGDFPVDPHTAASAPALLRIRVTKVFNPGKIPFQVFLYLSTSEAAGSKAEKIPVGNVGFYPVDQPGAFQLRASTAFAKLKAANPKAKDVRLLLEMERLHPDQPWTPVEITVAPPVWKSGVDP
jgi:hypothetical protein